MHVTPVNDIKGQTGENTQYYTYTTDITKYYTVM